MKSRVIAGIWIVCAVVALIAGVIGPLREGEAWARWLGIVMAALTGYGLVFTFTGRVMGVPIRFLRRFPLLFWLLVIVGLSVGLGLWLVPYQPTNGRRLTPAEYVYVAFLIWALLYVLFFGMDREQARAMGARLGRSRLTGLLVMLTTFTLLFWLGEAYLRIFYITTDGFGLTAMNYHWYVNFGWGQNNSLGFRDYEPKPDAPGLIRVGVLGDSFAMGHGINNLDDTFAQVLERLLGEDYDVNVIAQSGWDTDVHLYNLDRYPLRPNIVILSYYLNDIDYVFGNPEEVATRYFSFAPQGIVHTFIRDFFVPNFIYYNLMQLTSAARTSNHLQDLVNAHLDEETWSNQAQLLFQIISWCRDHDARLIVLLWPHLTQVDESQPALERLREFFDQQGVTVVDMSEPLRENNAPSLIVNRFDTHPGVLAHRLAAEALYAAIMEPPPEGDGEAGS